MSVFWRFCVGKIMERNIHKSLKLIRKLLETSARPVFGFSMLANPFGHGTLPTNFNIYVSGGLHPLATYEPGQSVVPKIDELLAVYHPTPSSIPLFAADFSQEINPTLDPKPEQGPATEEPARESLPPLLTSRGGLRLEPTSQFWEGNASWYDEDHCIGCDKKHYPPHTANGMPMNSEDLTLAFMRAPLNRHVLVQHISRETGEVVGEAVAQITDTGGFEKKPWLRIADLSRGLREAIGGGDITPVRITLLEESAIPDSPSTSSPGWDDEVS